MNKALRLTFPLVLIVALTTCRSVVRVSSKGKRLHHSEQLIVTRISENAYIHTSYHQTNDFGNVPCNGLIVRDGAEVVIFDTPTKDAASEELIAWIEQELHCRVKAVVPTHFHVDCLGGLRPSMPMVSLPMPMPRPSNWLRPITLPYRSRHSRIP
jgi:metallo-beta-lactamase class B